MLEAAALTITFLFTTLTAMTVVPSLPIPFVYTPLMLMTGLLVMHRIGVSPGVAWIVLGALMLEARGITPGWLFPMCMSALLAALLVERVFATRSVYALLGLGLVTGVAAVVLYSIAKLIGGIVSGTPVAFGALLREDVWTLLLLLAGLYIGFTTIVTVREWLQRLFVVR